MPANSLIQRLPRHLKFSELRIFVAVLEQRSFRKAAAVVHLTQPAVTKAIAGLEETLGAKLFDRNDNGVEPTVHGLSFAPRAIATLQALRRERLRWFLPAVVVFLVLSFAFTRELLALFRPEFANVGVMPLRVLAVSTAFTVLLSLAPTYLKFRQRNRATYTAVGIAAAAQGVLLMWLVPAHGATGAALAYAISMCGMYAAFAWMAHRELQQFKG